MSRVHDSEWEGTFEVQSSVAVSRVKVSADGRGVVSHAGVGMLREVAVPDLDALVACIREGLDAVTAVGDESQP